MRALAAVVGLLLLAPSAALGLAPRDATPVGHGTVAPVMHIAALNLAPGIRPGAWIQIGVANCTAAFVLADPAGSLYITTAGHCAEVVGERAFVTHDAAIALNAPPRAFGTVVATWPLGYDAALIAIDPERNAEVNPRMTGWGGPVGIVTDAPPAGTVVRHYGWGWWTWFDHASRCRSGVLEPAEAGGFDDETWWHVGPVGNGDSGSGVITADGRALGILDWGGIGVPVGVGPVAHVEGGGVRFDVALAALREVTGLDLALVPGGLPSDGCEGIVPAPAGDALG